MIRILAATAWLIAAYLFAIYLLPLLPRLP
jgi:hypothetical protein